MTIRRTIAVLLAALLPLACCTACAPKEVKQANDSLTISCCYVDYGTSSDILNTAIARFRQTHPDVQIHVNRPSQAFETNMEVFEQYFSQLSAEIMAGKGPDLLWINDDMMDVYKMMQAGAFADLAPLMDADPDFPWDGCNRAVIEGARYKDCQYVMPLNYSIPLLVSEKGLLEKAGFDWDGCTDFASLWAELADYSARYSEDPSLIKPMRSRWKLWRFPSLTGIPWLDMENQRTDFSDERWPGLFEQYRTICAAMPDKEAERGAQSLDLSSPIWMMEEDFLMEFHFLDPYSSILLNLRGIASMGEPCVIPVYDVDGGVQAKVQDSVAIRRNSPNQQLAYEFIKVLLSPEVQSNFGRTKANYIPVSNEALKQDLETCETELAESLAFGTSAPHPDYAAVPHEAIQSFWEAAQKIDGAYFWSEARAQLYRSMEPYLDGKMSYEDAIKDAEETLSIYVSE